jgi:hypothetical protein
MGSVSKPRSRPNAGSDQAGASYRVPATKNAPIIEAEGDVTSDEIRALAEYIGLRTMGRASTFESLITSFIEYEKSGNSEDEATRNQRHLRLGISP